MKKYLSLVAMALLVAACGGGGGGGGGSASSAPPLADGFIAFVAVTASIAPETVDTANIDAIVATSPEDADPIPVS